VRLAASVTPHLANLAGHNSPAFHLRRRQDDGVFDRFAMHVQALWATGRGVWDGGAQEMPRGTF